MSLTAGTAHKTAATSNDDVGAAGVCTADVLIAPTEETGVEPKEGEEKRKYSSHCFALTTSTSILTTTSRTGIEIPMMRMKRG